jgi:hypothetical protein
LKGTSDFLSRVKASRPGQGFTKISDPEVRSKNAPRKFSGQTILGLACFCVGVNVFILRVGIYRVSKLLFDGPINQRDSLQKEILNLQGNSN